VQPGRAGAGSPCIATVQENKMADQLQGLRVAVIAADGVEQAELVKPAKALRDAGAKVSVIAPRPGAIQGMNHDEKADKLDVDFALTAVRAENFDALVLPGGVVSSDALRTEDLAVAFVRQILHQEKPIAVICHGGWTLLEAGGVNGRKMTSWPSLRTDLRNAGAEWVDEVCVRDGKLVTSRKPDDLPEFNRTMIEVFAEHLAHAHA
jgi:protease I